jgi:hypothetical protein
MSDTKNTSVILKQQGQFQICNTHIKEYPQMWENGRYFGKTDFSKKTIS